MDAWSFTPIFSIFQNVIKHQCKFNQNKTIKNFTKSINLFQKFKSIKTNIQLWDWTRLTCFWVPNWKRFYSIIIMNVLKMNSKWCQNLNGIIIHYTMCSQLKIKLYISLRIFHKSNNKCEIEFLQIYKEHVTKNHFFNHLTKRHVSNKVKKPRN